MGPLADPDQPLLKRRRRSVARAPLGQEVRAAGADPPCIQPEPPEEGHAGLQRPDLVQRRLPAAPSRSVRSVGGRHRSCPLANPNRSVRPSVPAEPCAWTPGTGVRRCGRADGQTGTGLAGISDRANDTWRPPTFPPPSPLLDWVAWGGCQAGQGARVPFGRCQATAGAARWEGLRRILGTYKENEGRLNQASGAVNTDPRVSASMGTWISVKGSKTLGNLVATFSIFLLKTYPSVRATISLQKKHHRLQKLYN